MRIILLLLNIYLIAFSSDTNKTKIFLDKYIDKNSTGYKTGESIEINKNYNFYKMAQKYQKDMNKSKDIKLNIYEDNKSLNLAKDIRNNVFSKKYQKKVKKYEDYILKDRELGLEDKLGDYAKFMPQYNNNKDFNKTISLNQNKILDNDERLIIAISSSVPKSTIVNYFKSLEKVNTDVYFVINGFIGNNPKYIMPTIKYFRKLMQKGDNIKDRYNFKLDINPKVFTKYQINKVPAVIFVKNYNPLIEVMGYGKVDNNIKKEDIYIAYGDSNPLFVLEKINKIAKSKSLEKFIKKARSNFFNSGGKK